MKRAVPVLAMIVMAISLSVQPGWSAAGGRKQRSQECAEQQAECGKVGWDDARMDGEEGREGAGRHGRDGEGFSRRIAARLGLSPEQQAQVEKLFVAQQEKSAPLRKQLAAGRKELHALTTAASFDEGAVQARISRQEALRSELALGRVRTQRQVWELLTPEQRVEAAQLESHRARPGKKKSRG